ncbi:MAG: molybdopterin-dependent oxidoreductase, partial [Dehalococcoidia bacterium]|nr:molybdopterin-dependent oxidoreductase [Dehalococcoidia bacterium]
MATVRTVCTPNCCNTCGILAHVESGRIVKVEPAPFPDPRYTRICLKGLASLERQYHPQRLKQPLRRAGERGGGRWDPVSWDVALGEIASRLGEIAARHGPRSVAFATLTGSYAFLASRAANRFASAFGGCVPTRGTIMGDNAGNMGMAQVLGRTTAHEPDDWANSRFIILWSRNMAETYMNDFRFILDAREKGARVIAIDPRFTPTAAQCDEWIPVRPGTDTALALSMMQVIIKEGLHDRDFMARYTVGPFLVRSDDGRFLRDEAGQPVAWDTAKGQAVSVGEAIEPALTGRYVVKGLSCSPAFQRLADLVAGYAPDRGEAITGAPAETIIRLAREYATSKPANILLSQGGQRYYQGHQFYRAGVTLAALTGNLGTPGGGASSIFIWPMQSLSGVQRFDFPDGKRYTPLPGMMLYDGIDTGDPWPIRAAWFIGYNFVNQAANPNRMIKQLFPKLDLIVVSEQLMTATAQYADYVLPVTTFYEADDLVLPYDNLHVQVQQKVVEPERECKADIEIFGELARKMGLGEYFKNTTEQFLRDFLASGEPLLEGITLERLREEGAIRLNLPMPFVPFAERAFPTPSGRAEFYLERLAE